MRKIPPEKPTDSLPGPEWHSRSDPQARSRPPLLFRWYRTSSPSILALRGFHFSPPDMHRISRLLIFFYHHHYWQSRLFIPPVPRWSPAQTRKHEMWGSRSQSSSFGGWFSRGRLMINRRRFQSSIEQAEILVTLLERTNQGCRWNSTLGSDVNLRGGLLGEGKGQARIKVRWAVSN